MNEEVKRRGRPPKIIDSAEDLIGDFSEEIASPATPEGWRSMETADKLNRIIVSETGEDQTAVYWRVRRVVNREKLRYEKSGGWTDAFNRLDITFEPKYWRPYVASEYNPIPRIA